MLRATRMTDIPSGLIELVSPLTGALLALADVPDPVFAGQVMGDGVGINPTGRSLVAPCAGKITHLARTRHAIGLTTAEGAELLLHIGIDTVRLNGEGFAPLVQRGDTVVAGQALLEFDLDYLSRHAASVVSVLVIANSEAFAVVTRTSSPLLEAGVTPLLTLQARA